MVIYDSIYAVHKKGQITSLVGFSNTLEFATVEKNLPV